jgi:hypothetical protein
MIATTGGPTADELLARREAARERDESVSMNEIWRDASEEVRAEFLRRLKDVLAAESAFANTLGPAPSGFLSARYHLIQIREQIDPNAPRMAPRSSGPDLANSTCEPHVLGVRIADIQILLAASARPSRVHAARPPLMSDRRSQPQETP